MFEEYEDYGSSVQFYCGYLNMVFIVTIYNQVHHFAVFVTSDLYSYLQTTQTVSLCMYMLIEQSQKCSQREDMFYRLYTKYS